MSHYIVYYNQQSGGGGICVKNIYARSTYQRGSGIESATFKGIVVPAEKMLYQPLLRKW